MSSSPTVHVELVTPFRRFSTSVDPSLSFHPLFASDSTIYFCESCLRFFKSALNLTDHIQRCPNSFTIPGDEVYRDPNGRYCIFEVDGRKCISAAFAKRVAFVTKLFLSDKQTLDDVHFFSFNALFELDDFGFHFVGHFSREWNNSRDCMNTLSCVVVLPPFRGKGYGRVLVELSYVLGRRDGMIGTPERPLSSDGVNLFRNAWRLEARSAVGVMEEAGVLLTLAGLCSVSGMIVEDALVGLEENHFLYGLGRQCPLLVLPEQPDTPKGAQRQNMALHPDFVEWPPTY